jgi:hypothetical protein
MSDKPISEEEVVRKEANKWQAWFYKGEKGWSFANHFSLFGSVVCSVAAGALLHFTGQRKWRSNRISRGRMDALLLDLETPNPDLAGIRNSLKEIILKHDMEIVGEKSMAQEAKTRPE